MADSSQILSKPKLATFAKQQLNHQRKTSVHGFSSSADMIPSTGPRSFSASQRAGSQPSTSSQGLPNSSPKSNERFSSVAHVPGRRLQMVLVMDLRQQKYLKLRELATKSIEAVAGSMNVQFNVSYFWF